MKKQIILLIIILPLFTGCLFTKKKTEENNNGGFTSYLLYGEDSTTLKRIKVVKNGIKVWKMGIHYYQGDIIASGENGICRVDKDGKTLWSISILNQDGDFIQKKGLIVGNRFWQIGNVAIREINLDTGEMISETNLIEKFNYKEIIIGSISGYKDGKLYFIKRKTDDTVPEKHRSELIEWNMTAKDVERRYEIREGYLATNDSSVVISGDTAYFGVPSISRGVVDGKEIILKSAIPGYITAFDLKEWKEKWRYTMEATYDSDGTIFGYPDVEPGNWVINGDKIIIPTDNGVFALNKESGKVEWNKLYDGNDMKNRTNGVTGNLYYDEPNKRIFFTTWGADRNSNGKYEPELSESSLYCVNADTGKIIWQIGTGYNIAGAMEIKNGYLYVPDRGIMVLEADTGKLVAGHYTPEDSNDIGSNSVGIIGDYGFQFGDGYKVFKVYK
jgi:outer membrane protein assembly factor BamB